jgi:MarR family transcriptional regulator, organic hydroperoxide resistance regulator
VSAGDPSSGGGGDALDTSLLFDVFALNQAVGRLLAESMRDAPLTPAEYAVASAIFELEAASPTQLSARLGMRLTTFMDHLRALQRRGFAHRVEHPTDRRSYRVVLTADGLAAHRAANRTFEAAYLAFVDALGEDGVQAGKAALRGARHAVDAARLRLSATASAAPADPVATRRSGGRVG